MKTSELITKARKRKPRKKMSLFSENLKSAIKIENQQTDPDFTALSTTSCSLPFVAMIPLFFARVLPCEKSRGLPLRSRHFAARSPQERSLRRDPRSSLIGFLGRKAEVHGAISLAENAVLGLAVHSEGRSLHAKELYDLPISSMRGVRGFEGFAKERFRSGLRCPQL